MCDYSIHNVRTRPARVGDRLVTRDFGHGTRGFASAYDRDLAVCVLPGTELAFANGEVTKMPSGMFSIWSQTIKHETAIFRKVDTHKLRAHHDALEFPDGKIVLLTHLHEDQQAIVLQVPAKSSKGSTDTIAIPSASGRVSRLRV